MENPFLVLLILVFISLAILVSANDVPENIINWPPLIKTQLEAEGYGWPGDFRDARFPINLGKPRNIKIDNNQPKPRQLSPELKALGYLNRRLIETKGKVRHMNEEVKTGFVGDFLERMSAEALKLSEEIRSSNGRPRGLRSIRGIK